MNSLRRYLSDLFGYLEEAFVFTQEDGCAKAFDCVDHNKLWKILKEMGIPDHLICLLRKLYTGQQQLELDMEQQTGSK